jgi:ankyrin repeat protein
VAADGNLALAKALVAKGANVNHASKSGATPLHAAAARSQKEMVDYLIAQGAKVDAKDKKGLTPIEYAEGRNAPADAQKRKSSMIDSLSKAKDKQ